MADRTIEENLRTKALAGAEALYRLTDIPVFDPALKLSLRKQATEFLGGITGMALFTHVRRSAERERLLAMALSIQELVRFSSSLGLITAENAERVSGAYRAAGEYLGSIRADEESQPAPITNSGSFTPLQPGRSSLQGGEEEKIHGARWGPRPFDPVRSEASHGVGRVVTGFTPNERQGRILSYLASHGRAQLGDIRQIFGDACSEKTLQRDLWQLADAGRIKRQGDNRWTVYSLGHSNVLDS